MSVENKTIDDAINFLKNRNKVLMEQKKKYTSAGLKGKADDIKDIMKNNTKRKKIYSKLKSQYRKAQRIQINEHLEKDSIKKIKSHINNIYDPYEISIGNKKTKK